MQGMSWNFLLILCIFIDIVYKIFIIFTVNFVIQDRESKVVEVGADLVESAGFGGGLDKADLSVIGVGAGANGFEFSKCGVSARDHGLPDINPTGLVLAQTVQGLIDHSCLGWATMDNG
jgi:hypothetical protein